MSCPNANPTPDPKTTSQITDMWPVSAVPVIPGPVSPSARSSAPSPVVNKGPAAVDPVTSPVKTPAKSPAKGPAKSPAKGPAKGPAKSPAKKPIVPPKAGSNAQSPAKKQKPPAPSGASRPAPAGNNGPPAKKQKVAAPKPNLPPPAAKKPANNRANDNKVTTNTNTAAPATAPAPTPRPRGRPRKDGGDPVSRQTIRAESLNPGVKPEHSPAPAGGRRAKKASSQPAVPWTVVPAEPRKVMSDDTSLLENGMFADATIVCLKDTWAVHKTVLCTRSKWFLKAFEGDQEDGQLEIVNLHSQTKEDVETLLKFIYSGMRLDLEKFSIKNGSFSAYARLFNLGETFELKPLADDAMSLLGQYCDKRLMELCSYDVDSSGREGVVDQIRGSPQPFIDDLLQAIKDAYDGIEHSTRLQAIFVSFVWAGRDRLFKEKELLAFVDVYPRFGTDMFKLMLGHNPSKWFPLANVARAMCTELDHTRKTQHPDRCEGCKDVFDEVKVRKAMYNPFSVAVRAGAWCATCVNRPADAPLWRRMHADNEPEG